MDDLKIIKKKYGEKMMHLCRKLFPNILETPGVLSDLMLTHFEPTKFLYYDIVQNDKQEEFKNYIYSLANIEKELEKTTEKSPEELLKEAGYFLYECKTEEEIQSFKKYYAPGEEICTFEGGRLDSCYVFFAVKKNVEEIRRENFTNPIREDEYGTSVISIQFNKGEVNTLSIKNRYNDSVNNPDNTFINNLDNIIPGLTYSFKKKYNYTFEGIDKKFEIPGYVNVNGKYYKYNYVLNNIYYCPGNIIIDSEQIINKYSNEPERYIIMDYFIIDLKEKTIRLYDQNIIDSFGTEFKSIENIIISRNQNNKTIEIAYDGGKKATIVIDKTNKMIEYHNNNLIKMKDYYLEKQYELKILDTPNLIKIGNNCLKNAKNIISLIMPNLMEIDCGSIWARELREFYAPKLEIIGDDSCLLLDKLQNLILPNLKILGNHSLMGSFNNIKVPNLMKMGNDCFAQPIDVYEKDIEFPNLVIIGDSCFPYLSARKFIAPKLIEMGKGCLGECYGKGIKEFYAPKLEKNGSHYLKDSAHIIKYTDANTHYDKEDSIKNNEFIQEEETKIEQVPNTLVDKLNRIIKDNIHKIKEFKKRLIEGVKSR